jgi:hypothetical protein
MDDPIRNDSLKSSGRLKQEVNNEHTAMANEINKGTL